VILPHLIKDEIIGMSLLITLASVGMKIICCGCYSIVLLILHRSQYLYKIINHLPYVFIIIIIFISNIFHFLFIILLQFFLHNGNNIKS